MQYRDCVTAGSECVSAYYGSVYNGFVLMDSYPGYYGHSAAACVCHVVPAGSAQRQELLSTSARASPQRSAYIHTFQRRRLNVCSFHIASIVLHLVLAHVVVIAGLLVRSAAARAEACLLREFGTAARAEVLLRRRVRLHVGSDWVHCPLSHHDPCSFRWRVHNLRFRDHLHLPLFLERPQPQLLRDDAEEDDGNHHCSPQRHLSDA